MCFALIFESKRPGNTSLIMRTLGLWYLSRLEHTEVTALEMVGGSVWRRPRAGLITQVRGVAGTGWCVCGGPGERGGGAKRDCRRRGPRGRSIYDPFVGRRATGASRWAAYHGGVWGRSWRDGGPLVAAVWGGVGKGGAPPCPTRCARPPLCWCAVMPVFFPTFSLARPVVHGGGDGRWGEWGGGGGRVSLGRGAGRAAARCRWEGYVGGGRHRRRRRQGVHVLRALPAARRGEDLARGGLARVRHSAAPLIP